jgi:hypothetical protein
MAKASGKEWAHYFRTDRATTYLEALSRNCEIAVTSLYTAKPGEGTWIHPRLAVDFARWISADFAVWMDAWFLEEVSQVRDTQPLALAPAPNEDLAFAGLVATMVEKVGGSAKNSLAISFTALANKHPDYRQLFLENQRLLCPSVKEFVNQTKLLEGLESQVTEPVVDHLTALAKEAGFINKKDKRQLVNALLCEAGLQFRTSDKRRGQAPYALTKQGARYAREETRPAMYQDDGAWVPQLLWNFQETLAFLISWINSNLQPVSSRG